MSWYPRIVVYPGFVDKARCEYVVEMARKQMYPSGLAYRPGESGDPEQQTRTSKGTFLAGAQDPNGVLGWIEERIAAVTLLPRENGEVSSSWLWWECVWVCISLCGVLVLRSICGGGWMGVRVF